MLNRILIANRGEIACRIIRTCKRLNIYVGVVVSSHDAHSLAAEMADEALLLPGESLHETYLNSDEIIRRAKAHHYEAIHPGYGFLSENAAFAEACLAAGLIFIGPSPEAMIKMGRKSDAKIIAAAHNVPLLPGYHGEDQSIATLLREAKNIGFPLLIKAVQGGGGKGMRVVERLDDFESALLSCKNEAQNAFKNDDVLLERYLTNPKHVEVQVFGDQFGTIITLFERECSLQRRHQKVVEEAPCWYLSDQVKQKMYAASLRLCQAIGYVGAGTIEFLVEDNQFYFMEMNTRLQVEHPVTEMITGFDLVEWQILVASGHKLPKTQEEITAHGHAIEVRLYAETPENKFLPSIGHLDYLEFPLSQPQTRIETGIRSGDTITPYYDPMIAKIITYGRNREEARVQLQQALAQTKIVGVNTNRNFLRTLIRQEDYTNGKASTLYIEQHLDNLIVKESACFANLLSQFCYLLETNQLPHYHFTAFSGFRLFLDTKYNIHFAYQNETHLITLSKEQGVWQHQGQAIALPETAWHVTSLANEQFLWCDDQGNQHVITLLPLVKGDIVIHQHEHKLTSPMPGKIIRLHVKKGDYVAKNSPLIVLEAMKMEHTLKANDDGTIADVFIHLNEQVKEGQKLLEFAEEAEVS